MLTTAPQAYLSIVNEIDYLGFTYQFEPEFDLTRLSPNRRVQVRDSEHYAPKATAEQFAVQIGERPLPPIVVTADNWIVDGNTRVAARQHRKEKFQSALVIDIAFEKAAPDQRALLHALAATLNQQNGVRLTPKEVRAVAAQLVGLGWKIEQIGRAIGCKSATVSLVKRELNAQAKFGKVGLKVEDVKLGASLRALGAEAVVAINDKPYREIASLAIDAGLNATEITETAKEIRALSSDSAALSKLDTMRKEMAGRIRDYRLTGNGHPPLSTRVRKRLEFLLEFSGTETKMIEVNAEAAAAYEAQIEAAIATLTTLLRMQKEAVKVEA